MLGSAQEIKPAPKEETLSGRKHSDEKIVASDENEELRGLPYGVQLAQLGMAAWTTKRLIFVYMLVWLIQFAQGLTSSMIGVFTPYVTSSFEKHALTGLTSVIANLASGMSTLPYSKIINNIGRSQGVAVMVGFQALGLLLMATCNNINMYCAAQVFYSIGSQCLTYTITVFIADTCAFRWRTVILGLTSTPSMITVCVAGPASQRALESVGLHWGFGVWCIILPVIWAPFYIELLLNEKKARQSPKFSSDKLFSFRFLKQFDVAGILILVTGLSLFLLSFNLYSYQSNGWKSPLIISFTIIGGILILFFPVYEYYFAPEPFVDWPRLRNRTVLLTYFMSFLYYMSEQIWGVYFFSILIVVFNQDISRATYIGNIYFLGSSAWATFLGFALTKYGHIKHYVLYLGLPLTLLGTGLQIKFHTEDSNIGYLIMCQVFICVGGGTLYVLSQVVVMAAAGHDNFPSLYALLGITVQLGRSIGATIATATWTKVFVNRLERYLPSSALQHLEQIYGSLQVQQSYPPGSPERAAIYHAYDDTLTIIYTISTCLLLPAWINFVFWHDYNVNDKRYTGTSS